MNERHREKDILFRDFCGDDGGGVFFGLVLSYVAGGRTRGEEDFKRILSLALFPFPLKNSILPLCAVSGLLPLSPPQRSYGEGGNGLRCVLPPLPIMFSVHAKDARPGGRKEPSRIPSSSSSLVLFSTAKERNLRAFFSLLSLGVSGRLSFRVKLARPMRKPAEFSHTKSDF